MLAKNIDPLIQPKLLQQYILIKLINDNQPLINLDESRLSHCVESAASCHQATVLWTFLRGTAHFR